MHLCGILVSDSGATLDVGDHGKTEGPLNTTTASPATIVTTTGNGRRKNAYVFGLVHLLNPFFFIATTAAAGRGINARVLKIAHVGNLICFLCRHGFGEIVFTKSSLACLLASHSLTSSLTYSLTNNRICISIICRWYRKGWIRGQVYEIYG